VGPASREGLRLRFTLKRNRRLLLLFQRVTETHRVRRPYGCAWDCTGWVWCCYYNNHYY